MLMACDKYQESVSLFPNYWMAYYYWGKCLHTLGKNKGKEIDAIKYFNVLTQYLISSTLKEACQKFEYASAIRPDDVYLKLEHASTLHDFALACPSKGEDLFREASIKYSGFFLLCSISHL